MATCTREKLVVETNEGTYTILNEQKAKRCEAEEKCTELDSILAPFTTRLV